MPESGRCNHDKMPLMSMSASSAMVIASQILAAAANQVVKVLETDGDPVNPFQILFVRMLITGLVCTAYSLHTRIFGFPFGRPEVRPLIWLRAFGGICGAGGIYYSITYLTLSQATALNFLAPMCAMIISEYMARGTLGIINVAGAVVALVGVVLVVQPIDVFDAGKHIADNEQIQDFHEKWKGVIPALVGVVGSTIVLVTVHRLGSRAHPLIVINAFAWAVVITTMTLVMVGRIPWPTSFKAWALMSVVGVLGGLMEVLFTAGVSGNSSSAVIVLVYSQVIWAVFLDYMFWDAGMNLWTYIGVGSVIGSLTMVSLATEITPHSYNGQGYEALVSEVQHQGQVISHDFFPSNFYELGAET